MSYQLLPREEAILHIPESHRFMANIPDANFLRYERDLRIDEKAELLNVSRNEIGKTVVYQDIQNIFGLYVVAVPGGVKVDEKALKRILGLDVKFAGTLPHRMTRGTCTPFIAEEDLGLVRKVLIDDGFPAHSDIDWAIPSRPRFAMQVPAEIARAFLQDIYGSVVERATVRQVDN